MQKVSSISFNVYEVVKIGIEVVKIGIISLAAPIVSLIAVPIIASRALLHQNQYHRLYDQTLTNGIRAKFGRIEGQNYTRWDGIDHAKPNKNLKGTPNSIQKVQYKIQKNLYEIKISEERHYELRDELYLVRAYAHGNKDREFLNNSSTYLSMNCPFQTQEDLNWLKKEFTRREKEDLLKSDLKLLRIFTKMIIPLHGIISNRTCEVYEENSILAKMGVVGVRRDINVHQPYWNENEHWHWKEAILFHEKILSAKLNS